MTVLLVSYNNAYPLVYLIQCEDEFDAVCGKAMSSVVYRIRLLQHEHFTGASDCPNIIIIQKHQLSHYTLQFCLVLHS